MHSIFDRFYSARSAWCTRQQEDLRVRVAAVADEAGMAPGPTGKVPAQHPPPPVALQLLLHLENKPAVTGALQTKARTDLTAAHLTIDEAIEHSHNKALADQRREGVSSTTHTHMHTDTHVALTCVDDSTSSAKVQILNTQLFTSTGRNTNRM